LEVTGLEVFADQYGDFWTGALKNSFEAVAEKLPDVGETGRESMPVSKIRGRGSWPQSSPVKHRKNLTANHVKYAKQEQKSCSRA
jgi:hypothetical protein